MRRDAAPSLLTRPASRKVKPRSARAYGAIRTALIGYGVAALTVLFSRDASAAFGLSLTTLLAAGVLLQLALIAGRALLWRLAPDAETAANVTDVLELVADGVTVLLFAVATLSGIQHAASAL